MEQNKIKNYMEDLIWGNVDSVLKDIHMCTCDQCKLDVVAIALNSLPPKYVVTQQGELYTKVSSLQQQFEVDIYAAITKAAVIVKRYPRHGEKNDVSN